MLVKLFEKTVLTHSPGHFDNDDGIAKTKNNEEVVWGKNRARASIGDIGTAVWRLTGGDHDDSADHGGGGDGWWWTMMVSMAFSSWANGPPFGDHIGDDGGGGGGGDDGIGDDGIGDNGSVWRLAIICCNRKKVKL